MSTDKVELRQIFLGLQEQMIAALKTSKVNIGHPGTKGDATELCWLEMLQTYLPKRYQAEKAIALDCNGQVSEQIDIIVFDRQYSPFLLKQAGAIYVPAESIYAVIEVKQNLGKGELEYAGSKAASVRRLHRTHAPIYHAGGVIKDTKKPFDIAAGLVALSSEWNPPFGESFEKAMQGLAKEQNVEFGCGLECGAFDMLSTEGQCATLEISQPETALISFFLGFLSRLQKLGTVPAIDISEYAKSLKK